MTIKSININKLKINTHNVPVKTQPINRKRKPKIGKIIWQLAATTTPATIRPPSIFSTRKRDIGGGQRSLPVSTDLFSTPGSLGLKHKKILLLCKTGKQMRN